MIVSPPLFMSRGKRKAAGGVAGSVQCFLRTAVGRSSSRVQISGAVFECSASCATGGRSGWPQGFAGIVFVGAGFDDLTVDGCNQTRRWLECQHVARRDWIFMAGLGITSNAGPLGAHIECAKAT